MPATTSGKELWLRQGDGRTQAVIEARARDPGTTRLRDVEMYVYARTDKGLQFSRRIDAKTAALMPGYWRLTEAREAVPGEPAVSYEALTIPSPLKPNEAFAKQAAAASVPFWALPDEIAKIEKAGFSATGYRLRFHQLLATPLLFAAMAILGAAFSLQLMRLGGLAMLAASGVGLGFYSSFSTNSAARSAGPTSFRRSSRPGRHRSSPFCRPSRSSAIRKTDDPLGRRFPRPGDEVIDEGRRRRGVRRRQSPVQGAPQRGGERADHRCLPFFRRTLAQVVAAPAPDVRPAPDQGPPRLPDKNAHGPIGEDGLSADELYLTADEITRNDANNELAARGHVVARYQNRSLRADALIYNATTGVVIADGHAELINPDGTVVFAEHLVMDDKMRSRFARASPRPRREQGRRRRRHPPQRGCGGAGAGHVHRLRNLCAGRLAHPADVVNRSVRRCHRGSAAAKPRLLSKRGHPREGRTDLLRARLLPSGPGQAPRASGLLVPSLSVNGRRGFSYQQPILWVVSPSKELD